MAIINNFPQSRKPVLQAKNVTPTKEAQTVISDENYDALSSVEVEAIPDKYHDVSVVTTSPSDVAKGKVFVDADGIEQTGTVRAVESGEYMGHGDGMSETSGETNWSVAGTSYDGQKIWSPTTTVAHDRLIRSGANLTCDIYTSRFGDAVPGDVVKGKTFSSIGGVAETGTLEYTSGVNWYDSSGVGSQALSEKILLMANIESDLMFKAGSSIYTMAPYSSFGDAETSDVLAGKTFTSAAGLKAMGTAKGGSVGSGSCSLHSSILDLDFDGLNGQIPNYLCIYNKSLEFGELHSGEDTCNIIFCAWFQGGSDPSGHFLINPGMSGRFDSGVFSLSFPSSSDNNKLRIGCDNYSFGGEYLAIAK